MKRIEILIDPQGTIRVQTFGFAGSTCQDATKALEEALGQKLSDQTTPEFYQELSAQESQKAYQ